MLGKIASRFVICLTIVRCLTSRLALRDGMPDAVCMTRSSRLLIIAIVIALVALCTAAADARPVPGAHAVALTDARSVPSYLQLVRPFRTRCLPMGLVWRMMEVSAYRWNGRALGVQQIGALRTTNTRGSYWLMPGTRDRVEFDGACFHNETLRPVLVAAWVI